MKRLTRQTLAGLPGDVARPAYDPAAHGAGIVHLGLGAFHRAHQAVYTDDVLAADGGNWRIVGVSLRGRAVADQLNPQDGLYAVNVKSANASDYRVIGAVDRVLYAPGDPGRVVRELVRPGVRIVTLTVTEKGYCHDPASGRLNKAHPAIRADAANPGAPQSAIGFLHAAIHARRESGIPPFTVVCCDNLPNNGPMLRRLVVEHAAQRDDGLAAWIDANVAFPATMIDRIVPATTAGDRDDAAAALRLADEGLVVTEPFTQWVIEDRFSAERPRWELAGAQLVGDVEPFELAKLRLLNGSHSTIAYLGYLAGYDFVHQAVADDDLRGLVRHMMRDEIAPTLTAPEALDLADYRARLLQRFENPALKHRTHQIAMDGSQKLPQRLLGTVRDRLRAGAPIDALALALAAWIRYVHGTDERGAGIVVEDPLAERLAALTADLPSTPEPALRRVLEVSEVFGEDLPAQPAFVDALSSALEELLAHGAAKAVGRCLQRLGNR